MDTVHLSRPFHLVFCFQRSGDTFGGFQLVSDGSGVGVDFFQMGLELAAEEHCGIDTLVVFSQEFPAEFTPHSDGIGCFWQGQVGEIVVASQAVFDAVFGDGFPDNSDSV